MNLNKHSGGSGKSYFAQRLRFCSFSDQVKACFNSSVSGHLSHHENCDNNLKALYNKALEIGPTADFEGINISKEKEIPLGNFKDEDFFQYEGRYYPLYYIRSISPGLNRVRQIVLTLLLNGSVGYQLKVFKIASSNQDLDSELYFSKTSSLFYMCKELYSLDSMPLFGIGEGFAQAVPSVITDLSSDEKDSFLYGRIPYVRSSKVRFGALDTPFQTLKYTQGFLDSFTQVVFEAVNGPSLSKGLASQLVSTLSDFNSSDLIGNYAPIFDVDEKDPISQISVEGYTSGKLITSAEINTSTDYRTLVVGYTSRRKHYVQGKLVNGQKNGIDVDRNAILPLYYRGKTITDKYMYDGKTYTPLTFDMYMDFLKEVRKTVKVAPSSITRFFI